MGARIRNGSGDSVVNHVEGAEVLVDVSELRSYAGRPVRVRLRGDRELVGHLRTELLTELSISVFLAGEHGGGATIYIEDIETISPP